LEQIKKAKSSQECLEHLKQKSEAWRSNKAHKK